MNVHCAKLVPIAKPQLLAGGEARNLGAVDRSDDESVRRIVEDVATVAGLTPAAVFGERHWMDVDDLTVRRCQFQPRRRPVRCDDETPLAEQFKEGR